MDATLSCRLAHITFYFTFTDTSSATHLSYVTAGWVHDSKVVYTALFDIMGNRAMLSWYDRLMQLFIRIALTNGSDLSLTGWPILREDELMWGSRLANIPCRVFEVKIDPLDENYVEDV